MVDKVRIFDGKKFLWDGVEYESEEQAQQAEQGYRGNDFDTRTWCEEGKSYLYTRRVVTEVVVNEG